MMIWSYLNSFWKLYNSAAGMEFKWNPLWTSFLLLLLFLSLTLKEMPTSLLFGSNLVEKSGVWATSCGLLTAVSYRLWLWEDLCVNSTFVDIMCIMCTIYKHILFPKWFLSNVVTHNWEDMYYSLFMCPNTVEHVIFVPPWVRCMGFLWLWTHEVRS